MGTARMWPACSAATTEQHLDTADPNLHETSVSGRLYVKLRRFGTTRAARPTGVRLDPPGFLPPHESASSGVIA